MKWPDVGNVIMNRDDDDDTDSFHDRVGAAEKKKIRLIVSFEYPRR